MAAARRAAFFGSFLRARCGLRSFGALSADASSSAAFALRSASAAAVPSGSNTAATLSTWSGLMLTRAYGLSQIDAVDRQRIRRHREAKLPQVEPLEVDEVLLERVVDRTEAGNAHVAGERKLRLLARRRGDREPARGPGLAATYCHVRRLADVGLELAQVQLVERYVELGGEWLGYERAFGLDGRRVIERCAQADWHRSCLVQA